MTCEVWVPVPIDKYCDRYSVSNKGNIRRESFTITAKNGKIVRYKERQLKRYKACDGYLKTILTIDSQQKTFLIHRLVAKAFLPNPNNFPLINHKDEDKTNNCVEILECCDNSYNNTYNNIHIRRAQKRRILIENKVTGETYNGIREASSKLNINFYKIKELLNGLDSYRGISLKYKL